MGGGELLVRIPTWPTPKAGPRPGLTPDPRWSEAMVTLSMAPSDGPPEPEPAARGAGWHQQLLRLVPPAPASTGQQPQPAEQKKSSPPPRPCTAAASTAGCRRTASAGLLSPVKHTPKGRKRLPFAKRKLRDLHKRHTSALVAFEALERENCHLKARQEMLLAAVAQQEGMVASMGSLMSPGAIEQLLAEDEQGGGEQMSVLLSDLCAQQLMAEALVGTAEGSGSTRGGAGLPSGELFTNRVLRTGMRPEGMQYLQSLELKGELVPLIRDITMRMALLLLLHNGAGPARLSGSLEHHVEEYFSLVLSLHVAADNKLMALGTLNFETAEEQQPPPGLWEHVVSVLHLDADQAERVCRCFQHYSSRRAQLVGAMDRCAAELKELLGGGSGAGASDSAASGACEPGPQTGSYGGSGGSPAPALQSLNVASSTSGTREAASGCLSLEEADRAKSLLEQLSRLNRAVRETARVLVYACINLLTPQQLARSIVHSYPFLCQPCAWSEVVFRRAEAAGWDALTAPPEGRHPDTSI